MQTLTVDSDEYGGPQHGNLLIMTNFDALLYAKIVLFFPIVQQLRLDDRWMLIKERSNIDNIHRLFNALSFLESQKSWKTIVLQVNGHNQQ